MVTGRGSVIGNYLIEHQGIDMISFTGGSGTGKRIAKLANMIPLVMELGGKDPAIVVKDANLDLAAKQLYPVHFLTPVNAALLLNVFSLRDDR